MRILVKQNRVVCADLQFEEETVYIGSKPGSGIFLQAPSIATQHAVLSPDGEDNWSLAPASSEALVTLNGRQLERKMAVRPGDRIGIGQFELDVTNAVSPAEAGTTVSERVRKEAAKSLPLSTIIKGTNDAMQFSARRFGRLSRISHSIAQCRDLRSLLDMTLTMTLQAFIDTRLAWIGVRRKPEGKFEFIEGRLSSGQVADDPPLLDLLYDRCVERSLMLCVPEIVSPGHGSMMAVPLAGSRGVLGMIYVDALPGAPQ